MTIFFYRRETAAADDAPLPPGLEARVWRPAAGPPPAGSLRPDNLVWWAFSRLGVFARDDFAELTLWREGGMVHRLLLTPRWYRFPFMGADDLQIGDLWTHPSARRQGLARAAIAQAHRLAGPDARIWYAVDAHNAASIGLIESCGYRLAGEGRRTRPLGLRLAGRFRLEQPA